MNNLDAQYLKILKDILDNGYKDENRTDVDTRFILGREIKHDMLEGFPLLTTKKVPFRIVKEELLWFISGSTDIRDLWNRNVGIWDGDWWKNYSKNVSSPYTLEEMKDHAKNNKPHFHEDIWDLGPIYGHQWRKWKKLDITFRSKENENGETIVNGVLTHIDQFKNAIDTLINNPTSRRIMVNAWNVSDLDKMTLPPCHYGFELHTRPLSIDERFDLWFTKRKPNRDVVDHFDTLSVEEQHKLLDDSFIFRRALTLIWNQRSADFPLGVPFNLASYGILLLMIADEVRMVPEHLIGRFGNCHIYENQIEGVKEQLKREPRDLPTLHVRDGIYSSGDGDFILENYNPHPTIKFPLTN